MFIAFISALGMQAQTNPAAFDLSTGPYSFTSWAATSLATTYPASMVFHTTVSSAASTTNVATGDFQCAYNVTSRSRIKGLDGNGISFVNTSNGNNNDCSANGNNYALDATLGLNSTGRTAIQVQWTGGTIAGSDGPTPRIWSIQLQYRIGAAGSFTNVTGAVYTSSSTGDTQLLGPYSLPSTCDNQSLVQLRWVYYQAATTGGGTRPELRLDNIAVTSQAICPNITASLNGATTICTGSGANLTAIITGGTGPYSLTYSNGSTNTVVSNYTSGAAIPVSPTATTTYSIVRIADANACPAVVSGSSQTVTVNSVPTVADAGASQTIVAGNAATLAANTPSTGTGSWSVFSGPSTDAAQFSSTTSPMATFTPAGGVGDYVLTWTISNAPCTPSSSNVTITAKSPAPTCGTINVPADYPTIQAAVSAACAGAVIQVASGTYNEQVFINKALTIIGVGGSKPIINFTGTPALASGRLTLFEITAPSVTIENLNFKVDLSKLGSAIIASAANVSNLTVKTNTIEPYRSGGLVAFGVRNAVNINYGAFRVSNTNPSNILADGNSITYNDGGTAGNTADDAGFRAGFAVDEGGGLFTGNTIQTVSQDIEARFGSAGNITITNNIIRGGGVNLAEYNAGAGTITVSTNTFDGTFGSTYTSALRLKNNNANKTTIVSGNTFTGHNWGVSLENYPAVTVSDNQFTPAASSTTYRHVTVNTKEISSSSGSAAPFVGGVFTKNIFNGSGTTGGTAVAFYNHDNDSPTFGAITLGTAGNENTFNAGIATFIRHDNSTGPSATGTGPNNYIGAPGFPEYGGNVVPTTMSYWTPNLNASNNKFDVGTGPKLAAALTASERATLETQLFHKPDDANVGLITYFSPVRNVTQNTFFNTIQSAIDAANANDVIELAENVFSERATITKPLTLTGVSQTGTIIDGTGLGAGNGLTLTDGVAGITVANMRIRSFANSGIYAKNNDNLVVRHVEALNNGERGIYLEPSNGLPLSNVTITDNILDGNTNRGLWIINGNKVGLTITNNLARNNGLTGLDVSEGTVTGATITSNTLTGNGDAGLSVLGANVGGAANLIANNTLIDNGRFGIEVKSSVGTGATSGPGSLVVENNTVSRTSAFTPPSGATRDLAGIAIIHRSAAVSIPSPETPRGIVVRNNTVSGFVNPTAGDGFGIVVEGVNYLVTGNTVTGNEVGIQEQQTLIGERGRPSNDSPQGDGTDYFDRGNSLAACGVITGNNVSGNTITDQRRVGPAPFAVTATASASSVCVGQPFSLSALVVNGNSPYTYQWTASTGNSVSPTDAITAQATVAASGVQTFTVTATDTFGCISSNTVSVTSAAGPVITAQPAASSVVCTGSPVSISLSTANATTYQFYKDGALLTDGAVPETGIITYLIANAQASDAGSYSVLVSGAGACSTVTSNTFSLTVSSVPTATLTASGTLTCAQISVTLTAGGGQSYAFAGPGLVSQDPISGTAVVNVGGTYSVTATSAGGCSNTATTSVGSNTATVTASITPSSATLTCASPSVSLTASGGSTYLWNDNTTNPIRTVSASGTYSVTVTSANGCTSAATSTVVSETTVPTASLTASGTLTCAQTSVTLTASGGQSYLFTGPGLVSQDPISGTAVVNTAGTYSVTVTSTNGCSVSATTNVTSETAVPTASILPTSATLTCASPSVSLTASGGTTYLWDDNTTNPVRTVSTSGTYSVTVISTNGCTSVATASVVSDTAVPGLTLAKSNDISCGVSSATLTANVTPLGSYTYAFGPGATQVGNTNQATVSTGGLYSVTVTSTNGCSVSAITNVTSDTAVPTATLTASGTLTCAQTSVTLTAGGGQSYAFSGPSLVSQDPVSGTAVANLGGLYSVTVTSAGGCTAVQTTTVTSVTNVSTPDFATRNNQAIADGLTSVTVTQNSPAVIFTATNCSGTLKWTGITQMGTTTLNAPTSATGIFGYFATCTVGSCVSSQAEVVVTIIPANVAPTVANTIPPQSATVGQAYSYAIPANTFADANGDALTLSVSGLPQGLSFNGSTTTISGMPTTATAVSVTVVATDSGSLSVSSTFSFTVSPAPVVIAPLALTLTASPPQLLTSGTTTLSATVSGGTMPYSFSFAGPGTITQTPASSSATISGLTAGVQTFTLLVSDATTPASQTLSASVSVTVSEANTAPTTTGIPNQTATVGQAFSLDLATAFSDAQTPNSLTLSASGLPQGLSLTGSTLSGTASQTGTSTVTLTATDPGSLSVSTSFTLTVLPQSGTATSPFAITGVSTISCTPVGDRINLSFTPQYAGLSGAPVSFSVVNELLPTTQPGPYSLSLYSDNPVITLQAQQAGVTTSFVYNWLAACQNNQGGQNTPPTVATPVANQTTTQGQFFSLNLGATFTDAQTPNSLLLSATGLPAGLNLTGSTLSGTASQTGTSTVTLTATDPGSLSASTSFILTVLPQSGTATSPFAITGVTTLGCTPVGDRINLSFTPQYAGLSGAPVSFSVVNELLPTTQPGPYSLSLYSDNPVITLQAQQAGVTTSFVYNWLAACQNNQGGQNTPPTVATPVANQTATQGQFFSLDLGGTFTDAQTPNSLLLSATGLPQGLSLTGSTLSGTASVSGVSTVTLTATDPGSLSVSTSFTLTVLPQSMTSTAPFAITGVTTLSCTPVGDRINLSFTPQYAGLSGGPVSFSVVNELLPTTQPGPYSLSLYSDNPVITLQAQQAGVTTSFVYNWLAACNSQARVGAKAEVPLTVTLLGNPVEDEFVVRLEGAKGHRVQLLLTDMSGQVVTERSVDVTSTKHQEQFNLGKRSAGLYLLRVSTKQETITVKVVKQ
ncbi:putative Ig domain-containing protein [Spirosoma soli]|uniref:Ig domain-containing protein n=2 Tax=Spirosoma soli TaxID=1770529 RepID=A0ABW5LY44_9BACT